MKTAAVLTALTAAAVNAMAIDVEKRDEVHQRDNGIWANPFSVSFSNGNSEDSHNGFSVDLNGLGLSDFVKSATSGSVPVGWNGEYVHNADGSDNSTVDTQNFGNTNVIACTDATAPSDNQKRGFGILLGLCDLLLTSIKCKNFGGKWGNSKWGWGSTGWSGWGSWGGSWQGSGCSSGLNWVNGYGQAIAWQNKQGSCCYESSYSEEVIEVIQIQIQQACSISIPKASCITYHDKSGLIGHIAFGSDGGAVSQIDCTQPKNCNCSSK